MLFLAKSRPPGVLLTKFPEHPKRGYHLAYVHGRLDQHLALVDRRLLPEATIPAAEKVFSRFEPHPEGRTKGQPRPAVELGQRLLIATCQQQLIHDAAVPLGVAEVDLSLPRD